MSELDNSNDNESVNSNQKDNQTENTKPAENSSSNPDIREVMPHTLPGRPDTRE
ncbi:MAG: hypothetical protein ACJAXM_001475 [Arenicella sp.]|jgi:hypothetical protein